MTLRFAIGMVIVLLGALFVLSKPEFHTGGPIPGTSSDMEEMR